MKLLLVVFLIVGVCFAKEDTKKSDLELKLEALNIPSDKVTPLVSQEKIYAVNERYSSLTKRFEFTFFGSNNFTSDAHLESTSRGATARYHINGRWSVGARYTDYFNKLSSAGEELFGNKQILPDTDYALKSTDGFVNLNTVYGKIRFTKDTVVYFDHYIALGYGNISLARGEVQMYHIDSGFSFWPGQHLSARFGIKNEFYTQQKLRGKSNIHNAQGYMEIGYLFGEGSRS